MRTKLHTRDTWSALRHEQHDVIRSFGVDSSEKFCSDRD